MASLSPDAYDRKYARIGDRIARRAISLRKKSEALQGFHASTGPRLASQVASALKRPGVIAVGRPTTADSVSAFHFSVRPITKGSKATALAGGTAQPGAACAHQRYVERVGAAEKTLADIDVDHIAALQQGYLERPNAVERAPHVLASFGNISDIYDERIEFWRLVEESEYAPKTHVITFNPDCDFAFWKAVDTSSNAPSQIVEAARDKVTKQKVDDRTAVAILTFFKSHRSAACHKTPAVEIEVGRGGRIQTRIIAELPHEVSAEKRVQIAKDFCETQIANIQPPDPKEPDRPKILRYWAVIHAPDADNDSRNNHLHVSFYERPANKEIDSATGEMQWDFAIVTRERDDKRTLRIKRKREQDRCRITNERKWIGESRAYFAKLVNAALEEAGVGRRIDPRSFKDIGIDEKPIRRMEPKAYQKEKQGTPTAAGDQTIADQWNRELKRIRALYGTVVFDKLVVERFNAAAERFKKKLHTRTTDVETAFGEWAKAFVQKRGALAERAAVLFNIAKIRSRLTPPLDHRQKNEIDATKAAIDDLQKDELAPLNRLYRAALVKEKAQLATLAKLERAYSATSQQPPITPAVAAPPTSPASKTKAATPTTPSPAPSAAPKPAQARPTYGSLPGAGAFTPRYKPKKVDPNIDSATAARLEAERARQWDKAVTNWRKRHKAFTEPLENALNNSTLQLLNNPAVQTVDDLAAPLDQMFAQARIKEQQQREQEEREQAALDADIAAFDDNMRRHLRQGLPIPNGPAERKDSRDFINSRLKVFAEDSDPIIAAAANAAISGAARPAPPRPAAAAQKPQAGSPAAESAPPSQLQPASAAETPQAIKPADANAPNDKAAEFKAADVKAVEPQPTPTATTRPLIQRPNLYRHRTRELTPDERSAPTKTNITSARKPKDDAPETMPVTVKRRRHALHDEATDDNITQAAPSTPPAPQPTRQVETPPAAAVNKTPAAGIEPTAQPVPTQRPAPVEPTAVVQSPQASEVGPTINIPPAPGVKRRKKKKASELSPDERRRVLIARQNGRGSPER